ncbi:hypothetical protein MFLAVUS_000684 [Mucor flavus]|uniref:Uncharacterized protein n=1 Tax=Mucor flavus TaxID=439312 RepID=A0ABP9YKE3_9FUNG
MFKVKFSMIQLFDHVWYDLMANDAESYSEPSKILYSRAEMDLNHNTIREKQRNLPFFERQVVELDQQAWVRNCSDIYVQLERLTLRLVRDWTDLMYDWNALHNYYLDEYPSTGLDIHELDVRDRRIFQEWSLQLYKTTRMFRNHKREIHSLIPKYLKHSLNSSNPSYLYYNDTQSKMLWNTLALVEKNLKDVSNELLFSLYNSFGTVQYGIPVSAKHEYPMEVGSAFGRWYFYSLFMEKREALLPKLRVLWIEIPSTSKMKYFIWNASKWEKTKYIALEIRIIVTDIAEITDIVAKIQRMSIKDMMDRGVEKLRKKLNTNTCEALGNQDFQKEYYCKLARKALIMITDIYRIVRKKRTSCEFSLTVMLMLFYVTQ